MSCDRRIAIVGAGGMMGRNWTRAASKTTNRLILIDPRFTDQSFRIDYQKSQHSRPTDVFLSDLSSISLDNQDIVVVATLANSRPTILDSLASFDGVVILEKPLASSLGDLEKCLPLLKRQHFVNTTRNAIPHYRNLSHLCFHQTERVEITLHNANVLSNFSHFALFIELISGSKIEALKISDLKLQNSRRPGYVEAQGLFEMILKDQTIVTISSTVDSENTSHRVQSIKITHESGTLEIDEIHGTLRRGSRNYNFPLTYLSEIGTDILMPLPHCNLPMASDVARIEHLLLMEVKMISGQSVQIT